MMKGIITQKGELHLDRKNVMKITRCPYSDKPCGDWCPLFGSITRDPQEYDIRKEKSRKHLQLCRTKLIFDYDKLEDRREEDQ